MLRTTVLELLAHISSSYLKMYQVQFFRHSVIHICNIILGGNLIKILLNLFPMEMTMMMIEKLSIQRD